MVLKISQKLILITNIFILIILSGCQSLTYPRPTDAYYVNDFAKAFHPITKEIIISESEKLYEHTERIDNVGGAQIVIATFIVTSVDEIASLDRTQLFRQWKIGKNDMGVLIIMFFTEGMEDEINYIYLEETQIEVGYQMEQYLPASRLGFILDNTIYNDEIEDLDICIIDLYYQIINIVYDDVYQETFLPTYPLENIEETINSYEYSYDDVGVYSMDWLYFIFSPYSSIWIKIILFLFFGLIITGGISKSRNRGGGGSSGGYGIFRRR